MSSPWSVPYWIQLEQEARTAAAAAPEPFAAHAEMAKVDAFLVEALLPMLGVNHPLDGMMKQRGAADKVEALVRGKIIEAAASAEGIEAASVGTNAAMADVEIRCGNAQVCVDVKTRNVDAGFSMPNIVSLARLEKFYASGRNVFVILQVEYSVDGGEIVIRDLKWNRAEEICWSCLSIGNLGHGQLQIKNARKPVVRFEGDRCDWMRLFYETGSAFYGKTAKKAAKAEAEWLSKVVRGDG